MTQAVVRSKTVVLLLLNHCLLLLQLFVGSLCLVLVLLCSTQCPFYFCNLDEEIYFNCLPNVL